MLVHRQDFHSTFGKGSFVHPFDAWFRQVLQSSWSQSWTLRLWLIFAHTPTTGCGARNARDRPTLSAWLGWSESSTGWEEGNVPERAWWSQTNSLHLVHLAPLRPAILFPSFCLFASSCCTRSTTTSTLPQFHLSLVPRETLRSVVFTASQPQSSDLWQQKWHDRMLHRSIPVLLSFDNFYFQFDTEPCDKEMQSGPYSTCRAHIGFFIFSMPFMRSAF